MTAVAAGNGGGISLSPEVISEVVADLRNFGEVQPGATSTEVRVYSPATGYTYVFSGQGFGGFDSTGLPTVGTVTGFAQLSGSTVLFQMNSFAIPAQTVVGHILANDANALIATLFGGNDVIYGSFFTDELYGFGGNDTFHPNGPDDTIFGGDGDDTVRFIGAPGAAYLDGGAGSDQISVAVPDGIVLQPSTSMVFDFRGATIISFEQLAFGGTQSAVMVFNFADLGDGLAIDARIQGGSGADRVLFQAEGPGTYSLQSANFDLIDWGANDYVELWAASTSAASSLTGSSFNDRMVGSDHNLTPETLSGGAGNDILYGLSGDDRLNGDDGNDLLVGDAGNDMIDGGAGTDTALYRSDMGTYQLVRHGDLLAVLSDASGSDRLTSIESLQFTDQLVDVSSIPQFRALDYIAGYDDLIGALGLNADAGYEHFVAAGYFEGRNADGFDGLAYIAGHNDLIAAFGADEDAAVEHYILAGYAEGRTDRAFDAYSYLATHGDLFNAFGADTTAAANHYILAGFAEGRVRDGFDALQYIAGNGDLIDAFGTDEAGATRHYVVAGKNEGRSADAFDGLRYIASHNDLIGALGANETAAAWHYIVAGRNEGRATDTFDPLQYIASFGDLIQAFGTNAAAATAHFIQYGFAEGRTRDDFDAAQYLANYADLQAAFGANEDAATTHYINHGFYEGRTDAAPAASAPAESPLAVKGDGETPEVLVALAEAGSGVRLQSANDPLAPELAGLDVHAGPLEAGINTDGADWAIMHG